ncbi:ABC transporter permease [Naasia lichenicola]|uniref:ABC transporter permease n=1 Tax=Naasia lichenicola TaxID=2565933 RepID=A0A4S4FGF8_9MICO|nr:ABC transporter permease [Naasia lichenicola]THG29329.1 ABC transporter permease [Naasia lichenicola]
MTTALTDQKTRAVTAPRPRTLKGDHYGITAAALLGALVIVIVVTTVLHPDFFSGRTLIAIGFTMAITGILSVGQAIITISGAVLDLSIPAGLMLPAWAVATMLGASNPLPTALIVLIGVALGVVWGGINALIVTTLKINPIIVTLGTNFIGIAILSMQFTTATVPGRSELSMFGNGSLLLPNIWWVMLVVVLVAAPLLRYTRSGRHLTATGGSVPAARSRGISIRGMRYLAFCTAGICYGIAGVLFAGSTSNFNPMGSASLLLSVIAAVILAGVRMDGGRGSILLLLPACALLATVQTALVFFGLDAAMQSVFQGAILIIALAGDGYLRKRSTR